MPPALKGHAGSGILPLSERFFTGTISSYAGDGIAKRTGFGIFVTGIQLLKSQHSGNNPNRLCHNYKNVIPGATSEGYYRESSF